MILRLSLAAIVSAVFSVVATILVVGGFNGDFLSISMKEYKRCSEGGRDCYYVTGVAHSVLARPPQGSSTHGCYENTEFIAIKTYRNFKRTIIRCRVEDLIGEYVIDVDFPDGSTHSSYAFAKDVGSVEFGSVVKTQGNTED